MFGVSRGYTLYTCCFPTFGLYVLVEGDYSHLENKPCIKSMLENLPVYYMMPPLVAEKIKEMQRDFL